MSHLESILGPVARKRNRYFAGKFMTAEDFATDPSYLLDRHRLHQRLAHGWGVLCGLDVEPHPQPLCRPRFVIISPGIALDPAGRELILHRPLAVEVVGAEEEATGPFVVFLRYHEEAIEPVPTLYAEPGTVPEPDQPSRVLEGVRAEALPQAHLDQGIWPPRNPYPENSTPCRVPLALVRPASDPSGALEIDPFGRRQLGPPSQIEWLSWLHGQPMEAPSVLELGFSQPLAPHSGLDPYTFVVERGAAQARRHPVAGLVEISGDRRRARFVLTESEGATTRETTPYDFFITLKCDFILDHYGRPIDGGHLGGRLPTGSGIPGGVFESWFHVAMPSSRQETACDETHDVPTFQEAHHVRS